MTWTVLNTPKIQNPKEPHSQLRVTVGVPLPSFGRPDSRRDYLPWWPNSCTYPPPVTNCVASFTCKVTARNFDRFSALILIKEHACVSNLIVEQCQDFKLFFLTLLQGSRLAGLHVSMLRALDFALFSSVFIFMQWDSREEHGTIMARAGLAARLGDICIGTKDSGFYLRPDSGESTKKIATAHMETNLVLCFLTVIGGTANSQAFISAAVSSLC